MIIQNLTNMIKEEILNKPIMTMTGREFLELFGKAINTPAKVKDFSQTECVFGLDGLASLIGCKKTKAQQVKNSGILDDAIIQNGRKLIIDKNKALELLKANA